MMEGTDKDRWTGGSKGETKENPTQMITVKKEGQKKRWMDGLKIWKERDEGRKMERER